MWAFNQYSSLDFHRHTTMIKAVKIFDIAIEPAKMHEKECYTTQMLADYIMDV